MEKALHATTAGICTTQGIAMQLRTPMLAQVQYGVNTLPGSINPPPKPCIHMLPHTFQVPPTPKGPAGTIKLYSISALHPPATGTGICEWACSAAHVAAEEGGSPVNV